MKQKIVIATRGSRLAIIQSEIVKRILTSLFPHFVVEFLEVVTHGDIDLKTPLSGFGDSGVFVKSLEETLLSGEADLAVHSLKDVPSTLHPLLELASFPEREDPRDVLVTRNGENWRDLKQGSIVGTSSSARKEQFKLLRPDVLFKEIRGNVDTRISKVMKGEYDATILAAAGLKRLCHKIEEQSYFSLDEMVPSPGQGALVIQVHKNNTEILDLIRQTNDEKVEMQVRAERIFMTEIGGGCRFPVAAHAEFNGKNVIFRGVAFKPGFKQLEKIKIDTSATDLFKNAESEAQKLIRKYPNIQ